VSELAALMDDRGKG